MEEGWRWISDGALARLSGALEEPDLEGTRYLLAARLGSGGMGAVYLVEDRELERRVALKVLPFPDTGGDLARRLLREARVLARLEHPGIVPVHDVGHLADGRVYYTMKYVAGERLDVHLRRTDSIRERLRLFLRVAETVGFAHVRGVIHRDLKPDNVMVGRFGEVLVLDWGLAKRIDTTEAPAPEPAPASTAEPAVAPPIAASTPTDSTPPGACGGGPDGGAAYGGADGVPGAAIDHAIAAVRTAHGAILGTPGYMAPEQERGERLDARADVFALGRILRFLLAPGETDAARAPRPLAAICRRATEPDPARRYGDATELAADVGRFLDGEPVLAHAEGPLERARRIAARHRTAILLVLTYLLVRVLLILRGGAG